MWGVSLRHPMLALFLSEEFLLHIPCWLHFSVGSFSYTSRAGFFYFYFFIFAVGCFSGVQSSLKTNPKEKSWVEDGPDSFVLSSFFSGEFLLNIPWCFCFFKFLGVSLTHLVLASFFCGEFLLHIPCWLRFSVGNFSYTSRAGFFYFSFLFFCWELLWYAVFSEDKP